MLGASLSNFALLSLLCTSIHCTTQRTIVSWCNGVLHVFGSSCIVLDLTLRGGAFSGQKVALKLWTEVAPVIQKICISCRTIAMQAKLSWAEPNSMRGFCCLPMIFLSSSILLWPLLVKGITSSSCILCQTYSVILFWNGQWSVELYHFLMFLSEMQASKCAKLDTIQLTDWASLCKFHSISANTSILRASFIDIKCKRSALPKKCSSLCRSSLSIKSSHHTRTHTWGSVVCLSQWCQCPTPWSFCCGLLPKVNSINIEAFDTLAACPILNIQWGLLSGRFEILELARDKCTGNPPLLYTTCKLVS